MYKVCPGNEAQFTHQGGVLVDGIAKTKKWQITLIGSIF